MLALPNIIYWQSIVAEDQSFSMYVRTLTLFSFAIQSDMLETNALAPAVKHGDLLYYEYRGEVFLSRRERGRKETR